MNLAYTPTQLNLRTSHSSFYTFSVDSVLPFVHPNQTPLLSSSGIWQNKNVPRPMNSDNQLTWVLYFMLLAIHNIELSTAYINTVIM